MLFLANNGWVSLPFVLRCVAPQFCQRGHSCIHIRIRFTMRRRLIGPAVSYIFMKDLTVAPAVAPKGPNWVRGRSIASIASVTRLVWLQHPTLHCSAPSKRFILPPATQLCHMPPATSHLPPTIPLATHLQSHSVHNAVKVERCWNIEACPLNIHEFVAWWAVLALAFARSRWCRSENRQNAEH